LVKLGLDLSKAREELLVAIKAGEQGGANGGKGEKTPVLDQFCRDLTQAAASGELDPVIGRAKEIERIVQILSRRTKNNPVLIGEPGVGKSAIVEGLAELIVSGNIRRFCGKAVLSLDLAGCWPARVSGRV
jgi:ATP-dependent Clp protease ATP-binding subunit ClpC